MKTDIESRTDIITLVDAFYKKVEKNAWIGPIFTDVAAINWAHHLPKMYDFWESILFGKATYKGNPMLVHFSLSAKTPMQKQQFDIWKSIFFETVDELYEGKNADLIKQKAQSIADLMAFKLNSPKSKLNIL
ncbi:group III truncated hemoglobin [Pedobacter sp. AW1-32]|uniref:group III truncated hemoglobin n=1 Tax=Pedobacter sp. AW1-32 TaxID=3383026 RepID=UPI003FEE3BD3